MKIALALLLGGLLYGAIVFGLVNMAGDSGSNTPNGVHPGVPLPGSVSVQPSHGS